MSAKSRNPVSDTENSAAEDHLPRLEETADKYGLSGDFDFTIERPLDEGAVAATTKIPGLEIEQVDSYEDFKEYETAMVDELGNIYGVKRDQQIGFIAGSDIYSDLDEETSEHVDLHELQHLEQYKEDQLWGETLGEQYDLSDEMVFQLNYVDRLMDLNEDPVFGNLVNDAEVTALVEGYTQRVTEAMQDEGEGVGQDFYPGYTQVADHIMKEVYGTDPEEEFSV